MAGRYPLQCARPNARVAKSVDARDLKRNLSTRLETVGVNGVKFGETAPLRVCSDCNPELSLRKAILVPIGRSECVAVRTEKTQIVEAIVFSVSIDMVEFERNRLIQPCSQATHSTGGRQHTLPQSS